jgi:hypothetical protein
MGNEIGTFDWSVRDRIYATILERGVPPTVAEAAAELEVSPEHVRAAYERLNARHAFFLTPGTHQVRMAHPFSGIETPFRVIANGRAYWANCAWDALGIPAALHADARVDADTGDDGASVRLTIKSGGVRGWDGLVHFALPFRRWYDDLILT